MIFHFFDTRSCNFEFWEKEIIILLNCEITKHFLDRVNDERNRKPITPAELTRLFKQEYKRYGKPIAKMGPDKEAVIKDLQTNLNLF